MRRADTFDPAAGGVSVQEGGRSNPSCLRVKQRSYGNEQAAKGNVNGRSRSLVGRNRRDDE